MSKNDEHDNPGLLPPKPVLKRLNWTQEYERGADESIDEPPIFASTTSDSVLDESLSVEFGWPSLSTAGHRLEPILSDDETTEGFTPQMSELETELLARSNVQANQAAEQLLNQPSYVPRLLIDEPDIIWQRLNHREGYILSQVDGKTSFSDLLAIAGLPEDKTRRILTRLLRSGVIG